MAENRQMDELFSAYIKTKGYGDALKEISDVVSKYVQKVERQRNDKLAKVRRCKNRDTDSYKKDLFEMEVLEYKYNAALKFQKETLEQHLQCQKDHDEAATAILEMNG